MRILSGIQPSGTLHLGNYFGMMKPAIELQDRGQAFYFIADLHALTTVRDPEALRRYSIEVAADFLACGLDPAKAVLFRQSDVPEVHELAWILSTLAPMGLLERCHSYKDKTARGLPASHGLFAYPVLMAADILVYNSDLVPVGRDQKQHLEVARDLAVKFNETYGPILKLPEPSIREDSAIVPGLDGQKMSKSYDNTIGLFEDEKVLRKKVMAIPTDSTPVEAPKPTEGSTILGLAQLVQTPEDFQQLVADFQAGGIGYGEFKKRLLTAIWEYFALMRQRRTQMDMGQVEGILRKGAIEARTAAREVMARVREAVGLPTQA